MNHNRFETRPIYFVFNGTEILSNPGPKNLGVSTKLRKANKLNELKLSL